MKDMEKGYETFRVMKQFFKEFQQNFKVFSMRDHLTGPQAMVVGTLIHKGAMKISDLSKRMMLSNSTVSGIVDRLEKQNMVMRNRSTEDRRVVLVDVTPEFRDKAERTFRAQKDYFASVFNQADPGEIEKIEEGFKTFIAVMERHRAAQDTKEKHNAETD